MSSAERACLGCRKRFLAEGYLCRACRRGLPQPRLERCRLCRAPFATLSQRLVCQGCFPDPPQLEPDLKVLLCRGCGEAFATRAERLVCRRCL